MIKKVSLLAFMILFNFVSLPSFADQVSCKSWDLSWDLCSKDQDCISVTDPCGDWNRVVHRRHESDVQKFYRCQLKSMKLDCPSSDTHKIEVACFYGHCAIGTSACSAAVAQLEKFFNQQSHDCKLDSDCQPYYYRVNSWAPPVILPTAVATAAFEKTLLKYQKPLGVACAKEWSSRPPTEALGATPQCKKNQCIDSSRP